MELTELSVIALQSIGLSISHEGNLIFYKHKSFLVDEACAGLHLTEYGLLFALWMLGWKEMITQTTKPLYYHLGVLFLTIVLLLFSNCIRIVLLILFDIPPTSSAHYIVGWANFILYVLIPIFFLLKLHKQIGVLNPLQTPLTFGKKSILTFGLILLLFVPVCWIKKNRDFVSEVAPNFMMLPEFDQKEMKDGVVQFSNDTALIYMKPPVPVYRMDHSPKICWRGSGYAFKHTQEIEINGKSLLMSELKNQKGKSLYTTWWYDSGIHQTGDGLEWRKLALLNQEQFYLVNVTTSSPETLKKQAQSLLLKNRNSKDLLPKH